MQLAGLAGVDPSGRRDQIQGGANGALRLVLVGLGIAEIGHDPVAQQPIHRAARLGDDRLGALVKGGEQVLQVLGVAPRDQQGRPRQATVHHRQLPPLGRGRRCW